MRQLITRIEDRLHAKLKRRAAAEGRSLNALVTEILSRAIAAEDERALVRARLKALGRRAYVPRPADAPSRDEAIAATRGAGTAVSEALAAERARR